jgi:hypothetical protein
MPTNRTRPRRATKPQFTPRALEVFRRMCELETKCWCEPVDWNGKYWEHRACPACETRGDLMSVLHSELQLKPWQHPIERPGAVSGYPPGSMADRQWRPDLEAQARYRALKSAAAS